MSERSLANLPLLAFLARRLRGRGAVAMLALGGVVAAAVFTVWLLSSSRPADEVAVEVALPPPAGREMGNAAPPSAATPAAGANPAAADPATLVRPGAGNVLTAHPVAADASPGFRLPRGYPPCRRHQMAALIETAAAGSLPKPGADGRLPWQVYARPFPVGEGRARIAIVVSGLGTSAIVTREMIRRLPADITLAFEPAAADVARWGQEARAAGHEIMLSLPVQGQAFPFLDRGPDALAGDVPAAENRARLDRLLARLAGYVGALANVGAEENASGDAGASEALGLAGKELARRGLLLVTPFVEPGGGNVPQVRADLAIGPDADVATVRSRLAELETLANANGHALAVVEPTPAAAEALSAWSGTLPGKTVVLAPVSAVAKAVQGRAR